MIHSHSPQFAAQKVYQKIEQGQEAQVSVGRNWYFFGKRILTVREGNNKYSCDFNELIGEFQKHLSEPDALKNMAKIKNFEEKTRGYFGNYGWRMQSIAQLLTAKNISTYSSLSKKFPECAFILNQVLHKSKELNLTNDKHVLNLIDALDEFKKSISDAKIIDSIESLIGIISDMNTIEKEKNISFIRDCLTAGTREKFDAGTLVSTINGQLNFQLKFETKPTMSQKKTIEKELTEKFKDYRVNIQLDQVNNSINVQLIRKIASFEEFETAFKKSNVGLKNQETVDNILGIVRGSFDKVNKDNMDSLYENILSELDRYSRVKKEANAQVLLNAQKALKDTLQITKPTFPEFRLKFLSSIPAEIREQMRLRTGGQTNHDIDQIVSDEFHKFNQEKKKDYKKLQVNIIKMLDAHLVNNKAAAPAVAGAKNVLNEMFQGFEEL